MAELQQTKNSFKFIGRVTRLDKDGAFREDVATKGKNEGKTYRSLRFGVKTSETNEMTVSMFDFEPDEVFLWNSEKAKKAKEKKKTYKGERIPFDEWVERQDELREQGYAVLQTRVGLEFDENGKVQSKGLPSYVASKYIYDHLNNGDSVIVEGNIRYSTYENQQGKVVEQKTFNITRLHKIKDIDFEDEKFNEVTYFEQEIVFVDAEVDKPEKKVYVTGRTIDYQGNWHDTQLVVDYSDGEDGEDKGMVKLANSFLKRFKFGDLLNVYGDALNCVIVEEVEDEDDEEDLLADLGGRAKPQHAQGYVARTYISEMRINGVDAWDRKVYKEEDFVKEDDDLLVEDDSSDDLIDELGGKSKKNKNPFADDADDDNSFSIDDDLDEEISADDLPF